jgi:hypothetical protein
MGVMRPAAALRAVSVDGGALTTVSPVEDVGNAQVECNSTLVGWLDPAPAQIVRYAPHGGAAMDLGTSNQSFEFGMNESVFVVSEGFASHTLSTYRAFGGTQATISTATVPFGALPLPVDDAYVYWTNDGTDVVRSQLNAGALPEEFVTGQNGVAWITVRSQFVYWFQVGAEIRRVSNSAPAPVTSTELLVHGIDATARFLTIDADGTLYWVEGNGTATPIRRARPGEQATTYVMGTLVNGLAVDGTALYWVEGLPSGAHVYRLAK